MRVGVISDIHGNCVALDTALGDLRRNSVEQIVCLGDSIQGGAQPRETLERLRELKCPIVLGNADAWLLHDPQDTPEPVSKVQLDVRAWTIATLGTDGLDFLRAYQPTIEVKLDSKQLLLCFHGSPRSYDDILLPDTPNEEWNRLLGSFAPAFMAGGHTHTQQMRRVGSGLFFNPGSIGVVYDYHLPKEQYHTEPWAEYAILSYDQGRMNLDFHRVPYDVEALLNALKLSGRPHVEKMVAEYRASNR